MAQDTITIDLGGPIETTFTDLSLESDKSYTWFSASPQGDLEGVGSVNRGANLTRNKILGRRAKSTYPYYDAVKGEYVGTVQVQTVLNAPTLVPLAFVNECLDKHQLVIADTEFNDDFLKGR
jgi:hypothetical protein